MLLPSIRVLSGTARNRSAAGVAPRAVLSLEGRRRRRMVQAGVRRPNRPVIWARLPVLHASSISDAWVETHKYCCIVFMIVHYLSLSNFIYYSVEKIMEGDDMHNLQYELTPADPVLCKST